MFENKSPASRPLPVSPTHTGSSRPLPASPTKSLPTSSKPPAPVQPTHFISPAHTGVDRLSTPPPPPSSYRPPLSGFEPPMLNKPSPENVETLIPIRSRSPSPTSPGAAFKSLVASWRTRAGSPSQRVVASPGKDGRIFGRRDGWNVSIRRRKRNEGEALAEQTEEREPAQPSPIPSIQDEQRQPSERGNQRSEVSIAPVQRELSNKSSSRGSGTSAPVISGDVSYSPTKNTDFDWMSLIYRLSKRAPYTTSTCTMKPERPTISGFRQMLGCSEMVFNWLGGLIQAHKPWSRSIWSSVRVSEKPRVKLTR